MRSGETRRAWLVAAGVGVSGAAAWWLVRTAGGRVIVEGTSMYPALHPGDRLLVRRLGRVLRWRVRRTVAAAGRGGALSVGRGAVRPGDVVVAADPRAPARVLVKRVSAVDAGGGLVLAGDVSEASTDSREFGVVPLSAVRGRVWYRYAPPERAGRVRRA